jgi:hypothetical protein
MTPGSWHLDDDDDDDDDAEINSNDGQTAADEMNCDREYEIPQYIYYQLITLVQLVGKTIIL